MVTKILSFSIVLGIMWLSGFFMGYGFAADPVDGWTALLISLSILVLIGMTALGLTKLSD